MAGGFAKNGAVQEQVNASLEDQVKRARSQLPQGESPLERNEWGARISEARRKAVPGVRLCVSCQETMDQEHAAFTGYNRRGSKDNQLR